MNKKIELGIFGLGMLITMCFAELLAGINHSYFIWCGYLVVYCLGFAFGIWGLKKK